MKMLKIVPQATSKKLLVTALFVHVHDSVYSTHFSIFTCNFVF